MTRSYILAIDQGTSSTKSLVFDDSGQAVAKGSENLHTHYLAGGFVEQEPEVIYQNSLSSVQKCLQQFAGKGMNTDDIVAIGISNQRETFMLWDKTGKPLHNAVVWQCKRSVQICEEIKQKGLSHTIKQKTGLVIDPYFSATKLIWLVRNNPAIKTALQKGEVYFGTVDTWLLYKLTNGNAYATDYTNASRTMFFNINELVWDADLINEFGLTGINLPQLKSSLECFGKTNLNGLLGKNIPIASLIGDSHAAAFGEGCFETGMAKATLGTGCSILMNIGPRPVESKNGMITTICWSAGKRIDYALEGVIVSCGATIEWLKNELNLFSDSQMTVEMANAVADNCGVYLIPAFSGLGSPHWDMDRRASLTGISFATNKNHIVRAALESIPYQIKDVIVAMEKDAGTSLKELNADGGITANAFVIKFLTDLLNKNVATIGMPDVSALGAAYLAGLHAGAYKDIDRLRQLNAEKKYYQPDGMNKTAQAGYEGWKREIERK